MIKKIEKTSGPEIKKVNSPITRDDEPKSDKGESAEECLRSYFLALGFFVVRGVKLQQSGSDITDIDLWLCSKSAPFIRTRISVDIKNRKTPFASERILWAKGIQSALRLDMCIVATTDTSESVKDFARKHDVTLLDGDILSTVINGYKSDMSRLSESEYILKIIDKADYKRRHWNERISLSKSRVIESLDFNGCVKWLDDISFFIGETLENQKDKEFLTRYAYFSAALFLLGIDFAIHHKWMRFGRELPHVIGEGLMYGENGSEGLTQKVEFAANLMSAYGKKKVSPASFREELSRAIEGSGIAKVIEFCSRNDVWKELFNLSKYFELAAYGRDFVKPDDLDVIPKSFLSVILDYRQINRKTFFDLF
jgi:hypothetical protein